MNDNFNNSGNNPYGGGMPPNPYSSTMGVKDWVITLIICAIPCVNLIMLLVWAFSSTDNITRQNFAKAQLIITAAMIILYIVIYVIFGAALLASMNSFY